MFAFACLLARSFKLRFLLKYELTSSRKTGFAKKLCHTRREENVVRKFRAKKGLATLQKLFTRPVAEGNADEQLLFHLFDILFKCFTCRDVQIPRDKASERFLLSRRYRELLDSSSIFF